MRLRSKCKRDFIALSPNFKNGIVWSVIIPHLKLKTRHYFHHFSRSRLSNLTFLSSLMRSLKYNSAWFVTVLDLWHYLYYKLINNLKPTPRLLSDLCPCIARQRSLNTWWTLSCNFSNLSRVINNKILSLSLYLFFGCLLSHPIFNFWNSSTTGDYTSNIGFLRGRWPFPHIILVALYLSCRIVLEL